MASLTEKLLKTGSVDSYMMTDSKFTSGNYDSARTRLPVLNIALGGCITGGIGPGLGTIAGPSKHFKSSLSLFIVGAYLKKHKDAVCVFYDNEFGITDDYLKSYGVDPARVIHTPIKNVEDLKFDAIQKLEAIEKGERVIFLLDSMGNLASKKEVEDAQNEKSVADMSRAKQLKSFYRMITPYLTMKEIPFIQIAHTYETQELFSRTVISGGTGQQYSSNWQFIIGRRQEKEGNDIVGYTFVINIEKSRYVREKSKLTFTATYENGIDPYSGLLEIAEELGFVVKPSNGWFQTNIIDENGESNISEKKYRRKDTSSAEFWGPLLKSETFRKAVQNRYRIAVNSPVDQDNMFNEVEQYL